MKPGECGTFTITPEEAQAILASALAAAEARKAAIPGEAEAVGLMFAAYDRLREMGWREPMYAPQHQPIKVIEFGSTGIFHAYRDEEGRFWCEDGGETYPSRPVVWRPL